MLLSLCSGSLYNETVLKHQTFNRASLSIKRKEPAEESPASSFNTGSHLYLDTFNTECKVIQLPLNTTMSQQFIMYPPLGERSRQQRLNCLLLPSCSSSSPSSYFLPSLSFSTVSAMLRLFAIDAAACPRHSPLIELATVYLCSQFRII